MTSCNISAVPKFSKYILNIKYLLICNGHRDQPGTGLLYPWDESAPWCQPNHSPSVHCNCISSSGVHLPALSWVQPRRCQRGGPGRGEPSGHPVPSATTTSRVGKSWARPVCSRRQQSAGAFLKSSVSLWVCSALSHVLKRQDIIWAFQHIAEKSNLLIFFFLFSPVMTLSVVSLVIPSGRAACGKRNLEDNPEEFKGRQC